MHKRLIFLFIASIVIFVIIVFSINILIKKYTTESVVSLPPSLGKGQSSAKAPLEKNKVLMPEEEPERELPLQSKEPLLN